MNDHLKYDFEKRIGHRGWPVGANVTDADMQEALAVFVVIDPAVHKVHLSVKGTSKTSWVHHLGQWTKVEATHEVRSRLAEQAKEDAAKVATEIAAKQAEKAAKQEKAAKA